jgi:FlaA1/EpsC-like NDP-sugar epimerase
VIPIFKRQIAAGGPVTLTDDRMTRFIMGIQQSAGLVLDAVHLMRGGEVFVTKMPTVRIADLARVLIAELAERSGYRPDDIDVEHTGAKPGEKLYEELISAEESQRALELDDYYIVLPAFRAVYRDINYSYPKEARAARGKPYNSSLETPFSPSELRAFLHRHGLLAEGAV